MEINPKPLDDEEQVGLIESNSKDIQKIQDHDPDSHGTNLTCPQTVLKCLSSKTVLTKEERVAFYRLSKQIQPKFDPQNPQHIKRLNHLVGMQFGDKSQEVIQAGYKSDDWEKIGFQGKDPTTDFRGSGYAGLDMFIRYLEKFEEASEAQSKLTQEGKWLFACNSISATFWLKEFFHMGERPDLNKKEDNLANRQAFKNFCRILNKDPDAFVQLHQLLLNETFNLWSQATAKNPQLNIMDVRGVDALTRNKFKKDFGASELLGFDEFKRIFKFDFPKPEQVKKLGVL